MLNFNAQGPAARQVDQLSHCPIQAMQVQEEEFKSSALGRIMLKHITSRLSRLSTGLNLRLANAPCAKTTHGATQSVVVIW